MIKEQWKELGYINEPVDEDIDIKAEIRRMCKEKNAVILAHYYTEGEIQDIADFVGDSLALAQWAAKTEADRQESAGMRPQRWLLTGRQLQCRRPQGLY